MIPAISTTALSRRYRDQAALNDVSLVVEPGTVTGLLGRNGAGKTTLMRIVTGQEFPTSGAIRVFLFVCGALSMTRSLPFGLMLGVSRRSYYLGTALLIVLLGAVYGLALTVLQAVERATAGWGLGVHFFRVPWIMDGPWYQTWLTSFVLLVLFFLYGMWYGLVYRRWNVPGFSPSSPPRYWSRSLPSSRCRSPTTGPPSGNSSP